MDSTSISTQQALPLPNEIILSILNHLTTIQLLPIAATSRHFHSLIISSLTQRLREVEALDGYTLCLECHHPSARLTARRLSCITLGTQGLEEGVASIHEIRRLRSLYTSFKPQTGGFAALTSRPGDIPGSRTYNNGDAGMILKEKDVVLETITVEANDLFTQLSTVAYLAKCEPRGGLLVSLQDVAEGTIRVWRDWLTKRCESRSFSDQTSIVIHNDRSASSQIQSMTKTNIIDDAGILWVNTGQDLGIRLRVKYQKRRPIAMPVMYSSEIEVSVSYVVEIEEILVRTSHLLLKLEDARQSTLSDASQAIIFRSY